MKKLLVLAVLAVTVSVGYSQGQVSMNTLIVGGPRGTNSTTSLPIQSGEPSGTYLAQLYWAPGHNQVASALTPVSDAPATFGTTAGASGFISSSTGGGNRTLSTVGNVTVQIRAWSAAGGSTYEAAFAAAQSNPNILVGTTTLINTAATTAPASPGTIVGPGWTISPQVIPEPSTIALGLLGLGAIALFRRRK